MNAASRVAQQLRLQLWALRIVLRAGMFGLMRPDKYLRQALVVRRYGKNPLVGLSLSAIRTPHRVAMIDDLGELSWRDLDGRADALAVALAAHGAGPGVAVGVMCRNHRGLIEALAACARIGADALLLNTGFAAPQLADVVVREAARVVIYDQEFTALFDAARAELPALIEIIAWTDDPAAVPTGVPTIAQLVEAHAGSRPGTVTRAGRVVLLTSGTTGTPKGASRDTAGGLVALAAMFERIPWRAGERVLIAAPGFHAFGFGQIAIASSLGCTMVVTRRFDPKRTVSLLARHHVDGLAVVPVMLERIIDLPASVLDTYHAPRLRFVTASGSRMREDALLGFMDRFGDIVYNSYNATEVGLISTALPADLRAEPGCAGRPVRGTRVLILDDDDRPLPIEQTGRIAVASGTIFAGYTNGDTKPFVGEYAISGDTGRFDAAGRLFVLGRDDDMIVSGGENVFPVEVERTILEHPAVRECAVVGVADHEFGQRLVAFVVATDGAEVSSDEVRAHVRGRLAGFKVPREVTIVDELPRNASGKVLTRELLATPTATG
jgi:fatty-acyl-CoA synthase